MNNDNSCYANVVLQMLLHLGKEFYNKIMQDNSTDQKDFKNIYLSYFTQYSQVNSSVNSFTLRQFVSKFPLAIQNEEYLNGTQQTSGPFAITLISMLPATAKSLFEFNHKIKRNCSCGHSTSETLLARHIKIALDLKACTTKFYSSFVTNVMSDCSKCQAFLKHTFVHKFSFPSECQYVLIVIKLFTSEYIARKINSKFTDYDIDKIVLPLIAENLLTFFKIMAIVVRIGESQTSGHYIIWQRSLVDNTWLRISDSTHKKYKSLPHNLNNIEQIYLKKCL